MTCQGRTNARLVADASGVAAAIVALGGVIEAIYMGSKNSPSPHH